MNKRYQIFVSSTFEDLREERDIAVQTLMQSDCIPAGMELFSAIDIEQFEYIKKIIDESDYYLLIIGGRYGSITEEGISYTEKEYDYAMEQGKKVMAFLHETPDNLPGKKLDKDDAARERLDAFREKAKAGRLVKFWSNKDALAGDIALTIQRTVKMFPSEGWVRGGDVPSSKVLSELNSLRKENDELKKKVSRLVSSIAFDTSRLAPLEQSVSITGKYTAAGKEQGLMNLLAGNSKNFTVAVKIEDIFKKVAPKINDIISESAALKLIEEAIGKVVKSNYTDCLIIGTNYFDIDDDAVLRFKFHFLSLGLMTSQRYKTTEGDYANFWELTSKGLEALTRYMSFTKDESTN